MRRNYYIIQIHIIYSRYRDISIILFSMKINIINLFNSFQTKASYCSYQSIKRSKEINAQIIMYCEYT
jgi:uncharacterized protein YktA (UPF0223 family)